jgi:hypothetical protein
MSLRVNSLGVNTQSSSDSATTLISNRALIDHNYEGIVTSAGSVTKWLNTANRLQAAYFDGVNDFISTPDSGALTLTGAVQTWTFYGVAAVDWTPAALQALSAQYTTTTANRGWMVRIDDSPAGHLELVLSTNGSSASVYNSTVPAGFIDGGLYDIQITRNASTGTITFFTAIAGGVLTQLGSTVAGLTGTLFNSVADLVLGAYDTGINPYKGTIQRFTLHDDDRLAASWSADDYTDYNATTIPDKSRNIYDLVTSVTWTGSQWTNNGDGSYTGNGIGTVSDIDFNLPNGILVAASYQVNFTVSGMTSGNLNPTIEGAVGVDITSDGSYSQIITVASVVPVERFTFDPNNNFDGTISNISVFPLWTLNNGAIIRDPYDMDVLLGTGGLRRHDSGAVLLDGVSGSYVSTPESPAASVTGSCILYGYVQPSDNTPSVGQTIIAKHNGAGNQRGYTFAVDNTPTSGSLGCFLSQDGITTSIYSGTAATPYADGVGYWAFAVIDIGTNITFYTSSSSSTADVSTAYAAATQLGAVVAITQTAIFDNTTSCEVGTSSAGAGEPFNGQIHRAGIIAGLDPTATPSVDFNARLAGLTAGAGDKFFGAEMLKPSARTINLTDWTQNGTGSITDNGDGTVTLADTDVDAGEMRVTIAQTVATADTNQVVFRLSAGTAAATKIRLQYNTGGTTKNCDCAITWSDPLNPTLTNATGAVVDLGGGEYQYTVTGANNSTGNLGSTVIFFPAGENTNTGSVIVHGEVSLQSEWTLNGGAKIQNSGQAVVQAGGVGGIETTVAPANIPTPMTMFMVGKADLLNEGIFFTGKDNPGAGPFIRGGAANFIFDAGTLLNGSTSDTSLHLHTVRHNGDATTSYQIDSGTPVVGNAGTEAFEFGTFFSNVAGTGSYLTGSMGRFLLFDEELSDAEVAFIQTLLLPN